MQFGQVTPDAQLHGLSLRLPEARLSGQEVVTPKTQLKIVLGAPVWGCEGWKGTLYPPKAKPKEFLHHYSRALAAIELNSTFYGLPDESRIQNWVEQTPENFEFCPKVPRHISHSKDLLSKTERWVNFWKRLEPFGTRLGRVFLQLPDTYGLSYLNDLENLFKNKSSTQKLAVEFRHPEIFSEGQVLPEVCEVLAQYNAYPIISDTLGRRYSLHQNYIGNESFVRFLGRENPQEDHFRLQIWIKRLEELREQGLQKVYFFVHQPNETHCAETLNFLSQNIANSKTISSHQVRLFSDEAPLLF